MAVHVRRNTHRDGRELKWRNLARVWHLLDDPKGFQEYIGDEVRTFRSAS